MRCISNKTKRISLRVTNKEYESILFNAQKSNMNVNKYAETVLGNYEIKVIDGVKELTHELKKIGTNLNQLVILAHQGRITCVELTPTLEAVKGIWQSLNSLTAKTKRQNH